MKHNVASVKNTTETGKVSAPETIYQDLRELFAADNYQAAFDSCFGIDYENIVKCDPHLTAEIYYLWMLSALKLKLYDDVVEICRAARQNSGDYLDLAFFEFVAMSARGEILSVPVLAENYMSIWMELEKGADPSRNHTFDLAGQVLLMWGQALEEMNRPLEALDIYRKYLLLHPDDKAIAESVSRIESQSNESDIDRKQYGQKE